LQEDPRLTGTTGIVEQDLEAAVGRTFGARGSLLRRVVDHLDDLAQLAGGPTDGHAVGSDVEASTVEHAIAGARTAAVDERHLGGASSADPVLARQRATAVAVAAALGAAQELAVDAPADEARQDDREHASPHG
jgi:hypothetical protein